MKEKQKNKKDKKLDDLFIQLNNHGPSAQFNIFESAISRDMQKCFEPSVLQLHKFLLSFNNTDVNQIREIPQEF